MMFCALNKRKQFSFSRQAEGMKSILSEPPGRVPAVTGVSSGSASGSSPDGAAGVWTEPLSNPPTDTQPGGLCSRAQ